jgi:hypothetical protein
MRKIQMRIELDCANLAVRHAEEERDRLLALLKRFTDLDCCTGYTLSREDYAVFWDILDDARAELGVSPSAAKCDCTCHSVNKGDSCCSACECFPRG